MTRVSKNRVNFSLSLPPALVLRLDGLKTQKATTRSEIIRALLEKALGEPFSWPDGVVEPLPIVKVKTREHYSLCTARG